MTRSISISSCALALSLSLPLFTACDGDKREPVPIRFDDDVSTEPPPEPPELFPDHDEANMPTPADAEPAAVPEPDVGSVEEAQAPAQDEAPLDPDEPKPRAPAGADETPSSPPKAAAKKPAAPKAEPADARSDGKAIYLAKCKNCHGVNGDADTKIGKKHEIDSWKESGWKGRWTLPKVIGIVTNGKADTKMKAFKDKLSPDEIVAVSKYSRSLGK